MNKESMVDTDLNLEQGIGGGLILFGNPTEKPPGDPSVTGSRSYLLLSFGRPEVTSAKFTLR